MLIDLVKQMQGCAFKIFYDVNDKLFIKETCWMTLTKGKNTIKVGMNLQGEGQTRGPCIFLDKTIQVSDNLNNSLILNAHI